MNSERDLQLSCSKSVSTISNVSGNILRPNLCFLTSESTAETSVISAFSSVFLILSDRNFKNLLSMRLLIKVFKSPQIRRALLDDVNVWSPQSDQTLTSKQKKVRFPSNLSSICFLKLCDTCPKFALTVYEVNLPHLPCKSLTKGIVVRHRAS